MRLSDRYTSRFVSMSASFREKEATEVATSPENGLLFAYGRYALAEALAVNTRRKGDVLVPALCCEAVVEAVTASGNQVAYYDISDQLMTRSEDIKVAMNSSVVAVVAVAYSGWETVATDELSELLEDHVYLVIDCAHGLPLAAHDPQPDRVHSYRKFLGHTGALWRHSGAAQVTQRSVRNLTPAEVTEQKLCEEIDSNSEALSVERARALIRQRNRLRRRRGFDWSQAAPTQDSWNAWYHNSFEAIAQKRRDRAIELSARIRSIKGTRVAFDDPECGDSPLALPVWVADAGKLTAYLEDYGIETARWWADLPSGADPHFFRASARAAHQLIQLPVHTELTDDDLDYIAGALEEGLARSGGARHAPRKDS